MNDMQKVKDKDAKLKFTSASKDLIIFSVIIVFVFILSYFFNIFEFLVKIFEKYPRAITWIDEILTGLLTLSIGFAILAWRRLLELKKETAERIRLQEELIKRADTKAEAEHIIAKQLRSEIEQRKQTEKKYSAHKPQK